MAAAPCVLTPADSSTSLISYKPYLNTDANDNELVKPRDGMPPSIVQQLGPKQTWKPQGEMPTLQKTNALSDENIRRLTPKTEPPSNPRLNNYPPHLIDEIAKEGKKSIKSEDPPPPPVLDNPFYRTLPTLDSRYAAVERMKAMSRETSFPFNNFHSASTRRRFESVPDYGAVFQNGMTTTRYDDVRHRHGYDDFDIPSTTFSGTCAKGCPCGKNNKDSNNGQIHSKARLKYTPVKSEANRSLYERTLSSNREKKDVPFWTHGAYPPRFGETHPYMKRPMEHPSSPLAKDFMGRSMLYGHEILQQGKLINEKENSDKRPSAFSVIRSASINPPFSNDTGYSSEPVNLQEFYSKYRVQSQSEQSESKISHRPYQDQRRHEVNGQVRHDNKLRIYDEASKAALKAFDAHVEKMMAETRVQKPYQSPADPSDATQHMEIRREELQVTLNHEKRFSSTSSPPQNLVQVSTVDSTQTSDAAHSVGGLLSLAMVANEHLGQAIAKEKRRTKNNNCLHLWQFLRTMLDQEKDKPNKCIEWTNRERGEFRLIKTAVIADLWGQSKNRSCMTYEKMARAMRYYYKMKILEKVPHKRLHFRFGEKMLARVLDTTTLKPIRQNSVNLDRNVGENTQVAANRSIRRYSTPHHVYHEENNVHRPSSEGSLPVNIQPSEGLKAPQVELISHSRNSENVFIQNFGVIRSTRDVSKDVANGCPDEVINQRFSDSENGVASYSGDDTPISSPMSDSDGELVVDADVE